MNVGELKALLADVSDDTLVVMSSDSEGNNYSPLYGGYDDEYYIADSGWSGETAMAEADWQSEKDSGFVDEESYAEYLEVMEAVPCLLLVPTN